MESIDDFLGELERKESGILDKDEEYFIDRVFDIVFERNVVPVLTYALTFTKLMVAVGEIQRRHFTLLQSRPRGCSVCPEI